MVAAVWHNRLLFFANQAPRSILERCAVLISSSRDGEYVSTFIKFTGMNVVRGSSSRGGSSSVADGGWYDYPGEMGLKVTTDNNFKDSMNVVNMFVRYHILYCGMAADQLVFDQNTDYAGSKWNYVMGGEPYDYYETMLPHTLVKIWQPISTRGTDLEGNVDKEKTNYINRYITNNTLTDELATMGTEEMHTYVSQGVEVSRSILSAYNGYIHPINKPLIYDRQVVNGVLNERIRFDATTMLPEFINNGIRNATNAQMKAKNGGGSGDRVAFPQNFFG